MEQQLGPTQFPRHSECHPTELPCQLGAFQFLHKARITGGTHAHQILNRSVRVVEARPKRSHHLISLESHFHHTADGLLKSGTSDYRNVQSLAPVATSSNSPKEPPRMPVSAVSAALSVEVGAGVASDVGAGASGTEGAASEAGAGTGAGVEAGAGAGVGAAAGAALGFGSMASSAIAE